MILKKIGKKTMNTIKTTFKHPMPRKTRYLGAASALALSLTFTSAPLIPAQAEQAWQAEQANRNFDINAQPLQTALLEFAAQTDIVVVAPASLVRGKSAPKVSGNLPPYRALGKLLAGSGLTSARGTEGEITIISEKAKIGKAQSPSSLQFARNHNSDNLNDATQDQAVRQTPDNTETEDELTELEEIIITGSHIRGAGPVGSKVFTYDRSEIDLQGYATLPDFMRSLPQNFSGGITESTSVFGGAANGAFENFNEGTGVNLRGLGNTSTLVLLDGQRMAPTGRNGNFVDISMIPLSAVESVEVLMDGASAIYGSDAIGGVVNYKIRKDYDGAETRLNYGVASGGGLEKVQVGQTFGRTWDAGHGLISYEYNHRNPLKASFRSFSNTAPVPNDLLGEQERHSVFLTGGQNLTDSLEVFTNAYYSIRDSKTVNFFPPATTSPVVSTTETEQYGGSLGTAFDLGRSIGRQWHLEVIGSYNRNESLSLARSIDTPTSPGAAISRLSENISVDGKADGTLFSMSGGDAKLAIGGHYRHDKLGNLPVSNPATIINLPLSQKFSRDVSAVFGEIFIPLVGDGNKMPGVESLELSVSGRYEHYSDFGSSTDPKVGVKWSPLEGVTLRSTYGTSFRAPLFTELDEAANTAFLFSFIPNTTGGTSNVLLLAGQGNSSIGPEAATLWTAGMDINPVNLPNLKISLTYFNINYKDRIKDPSFSLPTMLTDPDLSQFVTLGNPDADTLALIANYTQLNFSFPPIAFADADAVFDGRRTNLARNKTTGLDFSASYTMETEEIGTFNFYVNGTYLFDYLIQADETSDFVEKVSTITNPVDLRLNGGLTWSYEGFTTNFTILHIGDYTNDGLVPEEKVDSWTTTNVSVNYNVGDRFGGWLDDTTFTISAQNLFDQSPPFVRSFRTGTGVNYDPSAANPMGRLLSFSIVKQW